jgi:hypothetical protein
MIQDKVKTYRKKSMRQISYLIQKMRKMKKRTISRSLLIGREF